jgi:protein-disulfide isomerase
LTSNTAGTLLPVGEDDHQSGSDQPELTLIEYGDFGCPFCFAAKRPIESLLARYDTLGLVWRQLPDAELHPGADLAAELSELAAVNGKFWDAHSLLLAGHERFSLEDLISIADRLGLDPEAAGEALRRRTYRDRVTRDITSAEQAGAHGTPTFFINGERLRGPWRQLAEIVPKALGEQGS